ncbi:MAG: hypothetical protein ACJA07_001527 [Rhodococcus sp. (in: high G+C Gram-positive bacteria)]
MPIQVSPHGVVNPGKRFGVGPRGRPPKATQVGDVEARIGNRCHTTRLRCR